MLRIVPARAYSRRTATSVPNKDSLNKLWQRECSCAHGTQCVRPDSNGATPMIALRFIGPLLLANQATVSFSSSSSCSSRCSNVTRTLVRGA